MPGMSNGEAGAGRVSAATVTVVAVAFAVVALVGALGVGAPVGAESRQNRSPGEPGRISAGAGGVRPGFAGGGGRSRPGVNDPGAPVRAEPVALAQPDGARVLATPHGDAARTWYTEPSGRSIVKDAAGRWVYATGVEGDGSLRPGGVVVGSRPPPPSLPQGLRPTRDQVSLAGAAASAVAVDGDPTGVGPLGHEGAAPVLVVLAGFSDHAGSTAAATWQQRWFGGTASVADYYDEVSYGKLDLQPAAETSGVTDDGIVGWLPLGYAHPDPRNVDYATSAAVVGDALVAADPFVDFAAYDTDGDAVIEPHELHLVVIMAGYETAWAGADAACGPSVWAHRWVIGVGEPVLDGRTVGGEGYATFGELHCAVGEEPGQPATIGIMAHELGHDLGWPDLYDVDLSSDGVGDWSLMAYGTWNAAPGGRSGSSPAHPDAFSKLLQGWVTAQHVSSTTTGLSLDDVATDADLVQVLDNPGGVDWGGGASGEGEYFLIENRQLTGYDAGLPGCGLAVWHIDESVSAMAVNNDESRKLVDLEEADGLGELDLPGDRGDAGDLFPGATGALDFSTITEPDSDLYSGIGSGVSLAFGGAGCLPTMSFDVTIGAAPTVPSEPPKPAAAPGKASVDASWTSPGNGGAAITGYDIEPVVAGTPVASGRVSVGPVTATVLPATGCQVTSVRVRARNGVGAGPWSSASDAVLPWSRDSFTDVGPLHPFLTPIVWMAKNCLSNGYPDGRYGPTDTITRGALAAFLHRQAGSTPSTLTAPFFLDVGPSHPFYDDIQWMAETGLSLGKPWPGGGRVYEPAAAVSRQAMAAFLHRGAGGTPPTLTAPFFADVDAAHPFYDDIQWMAEEGISLGRPQVGGEPLYEPAAVVSRQAMASFLHRLEQPA